MLLQQFLVDMVASIGNNAASTGWTRPAPGYAGLYELFNGNGRNYGSGVGAGFLADELL